MFRFFGIIGSDKTMERRIINLKIYNIHALREGGDKKRALELTFIREFT